MRGEQLVFSYGSNMLTARIRARCASVAVVDRGILTGHALRWHKLGKDGSGKCDALHTGREADRLPGVVHRLTWADKLRLDAHEGLGRGYESATVAVALDGGETVEAQVYVATRIAPSLRPFDWYRGLVLAGAEEHALPVWHRDAIAAVPATPDPDPRRAAPNRALLDAVHRS